MYKAASRRLVALHPHPFNRYFPAMNSLNHQPQAFLLVLLSTNARGSRVRSQILENPSALWKTFALEKA